MSVRAGDVAVADVDGVMVVPAERARAVADACTRVVAADARVLEASSPRDRPARQMQRVAVLS
jgi:regulator of RNase E activity RraA